MLYPFCDTVGHRPIVAYHCAVGGPYCRGRGGRVAMRPEYTAVIATADLAGGVFLFPWCRTRYIMLMTARIIRSATTIQPRMRIMGLNVGALEVFLGFRPDLKLLGAGASWKMGKSTGAAPELSLKDKFAGTCVLGDAAGWGWAAPTTTH